MIPKCSLWSCCRPSYVLWHDLAIIIDRTTSLSAGDLANERLAATALADAFSPLTYGGIAVFSQGPPVLKIAVSHVLDAIEAAISSITLDGNGTYIYDCIYLAATTTTVKIIVLMTDGLDNHSSHSQAAAIAACVSAGVKVFTIGFGAADASRSSAR